MTMIERYSMKEVLQLLNDDFILTVKKVILIYLELQVKALYARA